MENDQQRVPVRSMEEELICPILLELPLEPVMAEDGYVYEKRAIQKYFTASKVSSDMIRSPMTNEMIGKKLLPAWQTNNTIEAAIENGYISQPLLERWNTRLQEQADVRKLLTSAEDGNVLCMEMVGHGFCHAKLGFPKDMEAAYKWYDKARIAGSVVGMTAVGDFLHKGVGVEQNKTMGLMYLCLAAEKGSDYAAFWLGQSLAKGENGMIADVVQAKKWLRQSLGEDCNNTKMMGK